jgi:hypothetical protein
MNNWELVIPLWPTACALSTRGYCIYDPDRFHIRYRDIRGGVLFDVEPMARKPYGVSLLVRAIEGTETPRQALAVERITYAYGRCGWRVDVAYVP